MVIRSHGVPKSICEKIEKQGLECVDATCPFVKRIHKIVEKESAAGCRIVIIGNAGHPEVEGIQGWSLTPEMCIRDRYGEYPLYHGRIGHRRFSDRS